MKRIYVSAACMLLAFHVSALDKSEKSDKADFTKNNVKLNLFALPLKNISLQYERGLNENISVCMGVRFQPKSKLPFANSISSAFEDGGEDGEATVKDFFDNAKVGSWAITPEFRYYFGKKPLSGFYVAPYARIGGNTLVWTNNFKMETGDIKKMDFTGKVNSVYGGLLLGAQWHFGKAIVLDWWILGPSYGSMNIKLNADADLNDLSDNDIKELKESFEIGNFTTEVNSNGVKVTGKMPMFGLRTGLCIGYTF